MSSKTPSIDLSVIIITLNEEKKIASCLQSLPKGCELIVLDSFSQDRTEAIARNFGARFFSREFTNYGEQKNAALAFASKKWVLAVDADEILSPALRCRIERIVATKGEGTYAGYRLRRRLRFLGKNLRFGQTTDYPLRLFRRERGTFVHPIHERVEVHGPLARIGDDLWHESYEDLSDYFTKFNRYTTQAAHAAFTQQRACPSSLQLVLRPMLTFTQRYFLRLGFLDGWSGYCYALLSSGYVFTKYAKLRELYRETPAQQKNMASSL